MKKLLYILIAFSIACGSEENCIDSFDTEGNSSTAEDTTATASATTDTEEAAETNEFDYSSIVYDDLDLPVLDPNSSIKMLRPGFFHNEEIFDGAQKEVWYGLFVDKKKLHYVKKVNIAIEQVHDEIMDDKNEKTGWKISIKETDQCLALIAGIELKGYARATYPLEKEDKQLFPGDSLHIDLDDDLPTSNLYGTGIGNRVSEDFVEAFNYKLVYETKVDNELLSQILIAKNNFDDNFTQILYVGYLDDDELLDFIIDSSRHYNVMQPTLYLSSKAKKGKLVECVAMLTTTGC